MPSLTRRSPLPVFALTCLAIASALQHPSVAWSADQVEVDYQTEVKPILERCFSCHGALQQQGSLRLDTAALMRQGGDSGPAVIPGDTVESLLLQAVTGEGASSFMPPEGEAAPLTEAEIATLRSWILQGAPAPIDEPTPGDPRDHWAFHPPQRPELPKLVDSDQEKLAKADGHATGAESAEAPWIRTPIDAFIHARQRQVGLQPSKPAAKHVLLRRVYLDLIGLPPSPKEVEAFLADDRPDAYERVVQRLLDSPQYGERWGRHWMDVWRYGDWAGYRNEIRESQYHLWRWRDWIVESLNADRPYDQMVQEMLAGDELAPTDPEVLRATGYLGRNWYKFNRNVWLDNTVEHSGKAFLGLTFNCARCHDHKYDPISQAEYFQMRAVFETHDVRYDPVPGEPDVTKNGIARVFDKRLDDPTYLFIRGNEARPDKDHPLPPRLPELFSAPLDPEPIELPTESYYPSLFGFLVEQAREERQKSLAATRAKWEEAGTPTPSGDVTSLLGPSPEPGTSEGGTGEENPREEKTGEGDLVAREIAAHSFQLADAELQAFEARLAAERTKYGMEEGDTKTLAEAASLAERRVAALKATLAALEARQQVDRARQAAAPDDEAARTKVTEAENKLAEAIKTRQEAQERLADVSDQYSPLGEIYPSHSSGRRLALARWITSRDNPLTARVAVNHIWMRHFGQPLVATVFDFGLNGQPPTHPELLDWLAVELMENGWRMKPIHRLIVLSSTYRQESASPEPEGLESDSDRDPRVIDPDNRWLWRMNKRRMEAEVVRDSLLQVGESLDFTMGGPEIDQQQGQTVPRRSIYFRHGKEKEMIFTKVFDGPGVSECYQRGATIVPQQSLALANSPLAKSQARRLARRMITELDEAVSSGNSEGADRERDFIELAFWRVLARAPSDEERRICGDFLVEQAALLANTAGLTPVTVGETSEVAPADTPEQRARENLVLVLLNHHDFVTIH